MWKSEHLLSLHQVRIIFILGEGADSLWRNYSPPGGTKPHQMVASAPKVNVNTAGR